MVPAHPLPISGDLCFADRRYYSSSYVVRYVILLRAAASEWEALRFVCLVVVVVDENETSLLRMEERGELSFAHCIM